MKQIKTSINKKTKTRLSILEFILFLIFIFFITLGAINFTPLYTLIGFIFGLIFMLQVPLFFDFNKTIILNSDGIFIYSNLKLKKDYKYSKIKKGYTTRYLKEEFLILDNSKNGILIPLSNLSKEDKHYLRDLLNKIEIKDRKNFLH